MLALALHLGLLHGWPVTNTGLHHAERLVSSIQVRLLEPRPSPDVFTPVPPQVTPSKARDPLPAQTDSPSDRERPRPVPGPVARSAAPASAAARSEAPAAAPALRPAPDYLMAGRLDPGPKLLEDVDPVYPAEAGLREGTVVLRLLIGKSGAVDEVTVVRSTPPELFDRSALTAFAQARFSPGLLLGLPVKSQLTIELHFTPVDRGGNVSAPTY